MDFFAENVPVLSQTQHGLAAVVAFVVLFVPLLMIPFAFKIAGGIVGRINELLGGYGSKITEAIKGNPNDPNSLRNRTRRNIVGALHLARADVVRKGRAPNATTLQRTRGRFAGSFLFPDAEQRVSDLNAQASKLREQKSNTGDDSEIYAGGGWVLRAGEQITPNMATFMSTSFNGRSVAAGTTSNYDRFFDSKGREISTNLYRAGQRFHAGTNSDVAESISYAFYKAQTDPERAAARTALARNVLARNWSQEELDSQWAKTVYGRKDIDVTQWYSPPKITGKGQIEFEDVGEYQYSDGRAGNNGNLGAPADPAVATPRSIKRMLTEWNHSRQSYQIGPERDGGFRALFDWQTRLQAKKNAGGVLTQDEIQVMGMGYQVVEATSQRIAGAIVDGKPAISAAGLTPQSQAVVTAAARSSEDAGYHMDEYDPATGLRAIYRYNDPKNKAAGRVFVGRFNANAGDTRTPGDAARSGVPRGVQR